MPKRAEVHVHLHDRADAMLTALHDDVRRISAHLQALGARLMNASDQIAAFAARLDAATTEIAKDLKELRDKVAAGSALTPEDAAKLDALAARLERMGQDPGNPVPEV